LFFNYYFLLKLNLKFFRKNLNVKYILYNFLGNELKIDGIFFVSKKVFRVAKMMDINRIINHSIELKPNIFQELNKKYINPKELEKLMNIINLIKAKNKACLKPYLSKWKSLRKDEKSPLQADNKRNLLNRLKDNSVKNQNKIGENIPNINKNDDGNKTKFNKSPQNNPGTSNNNANNEIRNNDKNNPPNYDKIAQELGKNIIKNFTKKNHSQNKYDNADDPNKNDKENNVPNNLNKSQNSLNTPPKNNNIPNKNNLTPKKVDEQKKKMPNNIHNNNINDQNDNKINMDKNKNIQDNNIDGKKNNSPIKKDQMINTASKRFNLDDDDLIPDDTESDVSEEDDNNDKDENECQEGNSLMSDKNVKDNPTNILDNKNSNINNLKSLYDPDSDIDTKKNDQKPVKKNKNEKKDEDKDEVQAENNDNDNNDGHNNYNKDASIFEENKLKFNPTGIYNTFNTNNNNDNNNNDPDSKSNFSKNFPNNNDNIAKNNYQNNINNNFPQNSNIDNIYPNLNYNNIPNFYNFNNNQNLNNINNNPNFNNNKSNNYNPHLINSNYIPNYNNNSINIPNYNNYNSNNNSISSNSQFYGNDNYNYNPNSSYKNCIIEKSEEIIYYKNPENGRLNLTKNFQENERKAISRLNSQHINSFSVSGLNQSNFDMQISNHNKNESENSILENENTSINNNNNQFIEIRELPNSNRNSTNKLNTDKKLSFRNFMNNEINQIKDSNSKRNDLKENNNLNQNLNKDSIIISRSDFEKLKATLLKIGARMSFIVNKLDSRGIKSYFNIFKKNTFPQNKTREPSKLLLNNSLRSINIVNKDITNNKIFSNDSSLINPLNDISSPMNNVSKLKTHNNHRNKIDKDPQQIFSDNEDFNNNIINDKNQNNSFIDRNYRRNNNSKYKNNLCIYDPIPSEYDNEILNTDENNAINNLNKELMNNSRNPFDTNYNINTTPNEKESHNPNEDKENNQNNINVNYQNFLISQTNAQNHNEILKEKNLDKNNDPEFLKHVIGELNNAVEKLVGKISTLNSELANRDRIVANQKLNMTVLNERNKLQDEIKSELELLNKNIRSLENPIYLKNPNFDNNLKIINDRYKNLNLKIEIV